MEVLAGLDVGGDVPAAEHFRHVGELGEPGLLPEAVTAFGGHLDLGDDLAEGGGPAVEVGDARCFQQVGAQVVLHDPGFGDAVGDRGGGGEGDDAGAVAAAQVADLHVQVGGAHGPVDRRVGDVGRGAEVLVAVGFVDEQVVDAGGLEGDARVLDRVELGLEPFLGAQQGAFEALDGQPVALLGGLDEVPHPVQFGVEVGALGLRAHRDALERGPGHDDRVPVSGRAAGDELAAPAGLEVVALGDQDLGLGVELEELAAELLEHVVGHDDGGLAGQVQAAQFHRAHGHLGGFPGADLVEQADGGLVDDPGDGGDLVRAGFEAHGQAGQGQLGVVVVAEHDVVEQPVVGVRQLRGPGGVFPGPLGEPPGEFGGLFLRGEGVFHVQDPGVVADLVADLDAALFQDGLGELRGRVAAGAPGGGGQDRVPVAADGPDLPAGMLDPHGVVVEDVAQEVPDRRRRRSRRRRAGRRSRRASGRPG